MYLARSACASGGGFLRLGVSSPPRNVSEWFDFIDKPDDWDALWDHFEKWSEQKFGGKVPPTRKSAKAIVDGNEFYAMIWDYKNLRDAHEARGAVWA
jgi:hypothetical protein